jgi:enamine deaminase RidA (YjgF/YER057c/UK114 family)
MKASLLLAALLIAAPVVHAQQIKRTPIPNSNFPISVAVSVPAGADTVYFSGVLPEAVDGDTQAQTHSVLTRLKAALANEGLTFADVVSLRVFLVGDPKLDNKLDFKGLNASFGQFFGTAEQPNKPARTALQVVALPQPGALVEIDLIAARVKK